MFFITFEIDFVMSFFLTNLRLPLGFVLNELSKFGSIIKIYSR